MMSPAIRLLAAAGMVLLTTSCSVLKTEPTAPARAAQSRPAWRITQLHFGRDAAFAVCIEPACPAVTRKTLAIKPRAATSTAAQSMDIAATLDPGEEVWKGMSTTGEKTVFPAEYHLSTVVVTFVSGSAALSNTARAALDHATSALRPNDRILIVGRTDKVGSKRANQVLALARARAVRDYLRAKLPAHPRHAFTLNAQGACCFTASNDTPEGRRQNRRVEVVFRVSGQVAP